MRRTSLGPSSTTEQLPTRTNSERFLVSGASGFLGRAITKTLARDGASVRALVRRPERARDIAHVPAVEIVIGDITDAGRVLEVTADCHHVIHCAASLSGSWAEARRVNVDGTVNLARAAAAAGCARFTHISSVVVTGYDVAGDVWESAPLAPANDPYSQSKAAAEVALQEVAEETGLPYSIIRPGAIFGPSARLWTGAIYRLVRRRPLLFPGNGNGSIPAIYVDDVVDLCLLATRNEAAIGETFHATPQPSPSWREYLLAYAALAGGWCWRSLPMSMVRVGAQLARIGAKTGSTRALLPTLLNYGSRTVCYRHDKAQELLGWRPKVSLVDGVQRCRPWLIESGLQG